MNSSHASQDTIRKHILETLAKRLPAASPAELEERRLELSKAEQMDAYLQSFEGELTADAVHAVVQTVFEIDLDHVSLLTEGEKEALAAAEADTVSDAPDSSIHPRTIIDSQLAAYGGHRTGPEIRSMLNRLFGVNLDAISTLEKARISLYSKGQWIVQHDHDLFVVFTGEGDVDVKVYPTGLYKEQAGKSGLPEDLQQALRSLGYRPDTEQDGYYYADPHGQAVADAFKGQTMGAIMAAIRSSCAHL